MAEQLTLEQSIREILPTLPPPIRKFLQEGKLGKTVQLIMDRYALHVDHGAVLEHQLTLVLLGLEGPEEFATELFAQLPVSEQTVKDILGDLNKEVFVPLREEIRNGVSAVSRAQPSRPQPRPAIQHPPLQRPTSEVRPSPTIPKVEPQIPPRPANTVPPPNAAEPERHFHLQNKIPPAPRMNPSIAPLPPKAILPRHVGAPSGVGPSAPKLLQDHEEPHIEFRKTAPPPPNLPGVIHHQPLPRPPAPPYSTDPYREPVGGK